MTLSNLTCFKSRVCSRDLRSRIILESHLSRYFKSQYEKSSHSSHSIALSDAQSENCNLKLFWNLFTSFKQIATTIYRKLFSFLLALSRVLLAFFIATIKHAMNLSSASSFSFSSCEFLTMQLTIKTTSRSKVSFIFIDISRRRWFRTLSLLSSRVSTKTSSSLIRCARLVLY